MEKMLGKYTLEEVKRICKSQEDCFNCPFDNVFGCVTYDGKRPSEWAFWEKNSIDDAKAILRVFPGAETVLRTEKGLIVHTPEHDFVVNTGLLSVLPVDEIAVLKEIVGADE